MLVVCCCVMLVCTVILLWCVLLCRFIRFFYCSVRTYFRHSYATKALCSSQFLTSGSQPSPLPAYTTDINPHRYLVPTSMTQSVFPIHDSRSTDILSFSQFTKLKASLTTQVLHPSYLYTIPTHSTHPLSSN